ncbi:hypothetical protein B0H13DRAFT_1907474 [Mycena leptocephala]|nr:hypothetical protein B0H13DRAFT_1907474 [Mycena leptocephala]
MGGFSLEAACRKLIPKFTLLWNPSLRPVAKLVTISFSFVEPDSCFLLRLLTVHAIPGFHQEPEEDPSPNSRVSSHPHSRPTPQFESLEPQFNSMVSTQLRHRRPHRQVLHSFMISRWSWGRGLSDQASYADREMAGMCVKSEPHGYTAGRWGARLGMHAAPPVPSEFARMSIASMVRWTRQSQSRKFRGSDGRQCEHAGACGRAGLQVERKQNPGAWKERRSESLVRQRAQHGKMSKTRRCVGVQRQESTPRGVEADGAGVASGHSGRSEHSDGEVGGVGGEQRIDDVVVEERGVSQ